MVPRSAGPEVQLAYEPGPASQLDSCRIRKLGAHRSAYCAISFANDIRFNRLLLRCERLAFPDCGVCDLMRKMII